jgi:hypothetical protein
VTYAGQEPKSGSFLGSSILYLAMLQVVNKYDMYRLLNWWIYYSSFIVTIIVSVSATEYHRLLARCREKHKGSMI